MRLFIWLMSFVLVAFTFESVSATGNLAQNDLLYSVSVDIGSPSTIELQNITSVAKNNDIVITTLIIGKVGKFLQVQERTQIELRICIISVASNIKEHRAREGINNL